MLFCLLQIVPRGTSLAYSEKNGTFDLGVVSSSLKLGVEITKKNK